VKKKEMQKKLENVSQKLKEVHRLLLSKEREESERRLGKSLTPLQFFQMLTTDPSYSWLQPYTSLIAQIDTVVDENAIVSGQQVQTFKSQITALFSPRYLQHIEGDPQFLELHTSLIKALTELSTSSLI
jgi:hypothetical protein